MRQIAFYIFVFICSCLNAPYRIITGKNARWYDDFDNLG